MLSIVIPSHARPDLLETCLRSVTSFRPRDSEVIVVDDGSTNAVVSDTARTFPDIRIIRLKKQSGFCVAANIGIRAACGEVVELLNDDTEVCAGWADAALPWFNDPHIAALAPLVLMWPDGIIIDSAGDSYDRGGVARKRGHGQPLSNEYLHSRPVFGASASSAFYRRSALLEVGCFPESFGAYFEDVDLAFRLNRVGYRAMFEPRSRVLHRVSASYGAPRRSLLEQQSRNEERVYWRNLTAGQLVFSLPRHMMVLAGKAWRRWCEGNLSPFLRGRLHVLREVAQILRHRRRQYAGHVRSDGGGLTDSTSA
jgi:GT2 family glycosyltransferase